MIRFLLRTLGVLCLAASFVAVVIDGTRSIAARSLITTSLGDSIAQASDTALPSAKAAADKAAPLLGQAVEYIAAQPTAAVFGVIAVVLLLLGRRRHRRRVGFAT